MPKYCHLKLALLVTSALAAITLVAAWYLLAAPYGNARASGPYSTTSKVSVDAGAAESPVPGGPGFYSLSAFEFREAVNSAPEWQYDGPDLYLARSSPPLVIAAPVSLPNGATVTGFILYSWDGSNDDLAARLYRVPLDGNPVEQMAETSSAGDTGYQHTAATVIYSPIIDQQAYAYYVEVTLPYAPGGEVRLRGVRIDYGYGISLPLVSRED